MQTLRAEPGALKQSSECEIDGREVQYCDTSWRAGRCGALRYILQRTADVVPERFRGAQSSVLVDLARRGSAGMIPSESHPQLVVTGEQGQRPCPDWWWRR